MGIQDVNIDAVAESAIAKQNGGGMAPQSDSSESQQDQSTAQGMTEAQAQAILDLEKAQKFKFGDREWTPDQLKKSIMLHSDYTKKTQEVAQTRKYYDNLEADLDFVRNSPNKQEAMQMFMETYPKAFHRYLSLIGGQEQAASLQAQSQSQSQIPPELMKDLEMVKNYVQEKETQAIEAQLDATFSSLAKKYPEGDEDIVLARAQALLDAKRETEPGFRITNEIWEKLWKASHDKAMAKFEAKQKGTLEKQRAANQSFKGPASGGGTPGQAPVRMNMKQATEHAINTLSGRKGI